MPPENIRKPEVKNTMFQEENDGLYASFFSVVKLFESLIF